MENNSSNSSLFVSAVGIGVGLGVGLGLASTQLMASLPRGDRSLGGGAIATDIELELRHLLVDGQETKISFSNFPYYLRCVCAFYILFTYLVSIGKVTSDLISLYLCWIDW
jgi:ABC-type antimicrobial peptide transport system permease subunit